MKKAWIPAFAGMTFGVTVVGPRRCLGPGAMHRIAPTIGQAAILMAVAHARRLMGTRKR
jgi:hypothetical protein